MKIDLAHFQERIYHIIGIKNTEEIYLTGSYQTPKFAEQKFIGMKGWNSTLAPQRRFDAFRLEAHDVLSNGDVEKVTILREVSV